MKIFLSATDGGPAGKNFPSRAHYLVQQGIEMKWNLMSYYYVQRKEDIAFFTKDHSEEILIDSGAHSFQFGAKVDFISYTKKYADFIKRFDDDKVVGYFEMDIENIVGMDEVLKMREILESVSDKIIPVWHPERGINDYLEMCKKYAGKVIAVGGFKGTDIKDEQYLMFLKTAKKYNCKVHCLGMTRKSILDKVPFDFTDSSSWVQESIYGTIRRKKVSKEFSKENREILFAENYKAGIEMQKYYYSKWKSVCGD